MATRTGRWTALPALALLAAITISGCSAAASAGDDALALEPADGERHIATRVRDWFALLEDHALGSGWSESVLAEPTFELSLGDGAARGRTEVEAWLDRLRSPHPRVEFRVGAMRVAPGEAGLYRARFEVDRSAWDAAGALHLARWEHTWLVRSVPGEPLAIVRIEEHPSLAFPGTGPRIVCN